jgi:hypothetical protein
VRLRKRKQDEPVERFRRRDAELISGRLRHRLAVWAKPDETIKMLSSARPSIPTELSDRQADISEPLLAIADAAGGEWPERARKALVELCKSDAQEESINVKLLSDIRRVFEASGTDRVPTKELLEQLVELETDAPWAIWWENDIRHGNVKGPAARLSRTLSRFGIKARVIRLPDGSTPRGYLKVDLIDVWDRYCPNPANDSVSHTMQQCNATDKSFKNGEIDVASLEDVASLHVSAENSENVVSESSSRTATIEVPF